MTAAEDSIKIYHEQQDSLLCGMHCLNNLLQCPIFTEVDLSNIGGCAHVTDFSLKLVFSQSLSLLFLEPVMACSKI